MENYIGVKQIKARPMNRLEYNDYRGWDLPSDENGADEGYLVEYPDSDSNHPDHAGYISWSPKEVFEAAYFHIDGLDKISENDVVSFMGEPTVQQVDSKTALISTESLTGFVQHHPSSCVDPANYDEDIAKEIGRNHLINKYWGHLGFVLQWAKNGLKR